MKLSKLKIILLVISGLIILSIGGAIFYASSLIKPEEIRKVALEQIEDNFPNTETKLGKIELSLGLSVGLELDSLHMKLKKSKGGHELVSVKNLNVKIPLWSILMGGGTVDIKLDKPHLSYIESKKSNNWQVAMKSKKQKKSRRVTKKKISKEVTSKDKAEEQSLLIPALISQSKINVKLTDVQVNYKLKDKSQGNLILSKFLVKNLNFKTDSAFELNSILNYKLATKETFSVNTLVIGHFNLKEFIDTKELKSIVVINLKDIKLSGSNLEIPNIKTDLNVHLLKNGDLKGKINTAINGAGTFSTEYSVKKRGMSLNKIDLALSVEKVMKIVGQKVEGLSTGKSEVKLSGAVNVSKRKGINPTLEFELTKGLAVKNQGVSIPTVLKGNVRGEAIKVRVVNNILGGNITTNVFTRFNLNKIQTEISKLAPVNIRVALRDVNLPKDFIQGILYPEKKGEKLEKVEIKTTKNGKGTKKKFVKSPAPVLPNVRLDLNWANVKVDDNDFSGEGQVLVKGDSIVTKKLNFGFSKGKGSITQSTVLLANSASKTKIDMSIKALDLESFRAFLPPKMIKNIKGTFSGTVKGNVALAQNALPKHDFVTNISAVNGELVGVNISEHVNGIVSSLPIVKDKVKKDKKYNVDGTFERLTFKGRLKDTHYNLKKYYFLGLDKKVEIKGNGNIYPISKNKKGSLLLTFVDNTGKISGPMVKHVGTKVMPVKMVGYGFALQPDYGYTIKKLSKAAYKKKGKKVVKKQAKKQIKKLTDKFLKGDNKKKVNKLLKGLFK